MDAQIESDVIDLSQRQRLRAFLLVQERRYQSFDLDLELEDCTLAAAGQCKISTVYCATIKACDAFAEWLQLIAF